MFFLQMRANYHELMAVKDRFTLIERRGRGVLSVLFMLSILGCDSDEERSLDLLSSKSVSEDGNINEESMQDSNEQIT